MKKSKKKSELKVVFDTNVIFSGTANYLINKNTFDFIQSNSDFNDLTISWHLPDIVVKERVFQMIIKGNELLGSVNKIEKLLGHNLNITEEIIVERVNSTIANQISEHSLNKIELNIKDINWERIIESSINRIAPFENNNKEKGFRDALIIEALEQLAINSPKTPGICRIAFVCNDNLLKEAAKERLKEYKNIRFLNDLTSLKGLVNVLVSEIEEKIMNTISKNASDMFFIPKNENTIFYKEKIKDIIIDRFNDPLHELPDEISTKTNTGTWYISEVNFIKKVKQRIWLNSQIEVDLTAYKTELKSMKRPSFLRLGQSQSIANLALGGTLLQNQLTQADSLMEMPVAVEYQDGKSRYEVIWSVTYGTNKKILNPKIEKINFIENVWQNE